jgi:hypothetical protein
MDEALKQAFINHPIGVLIGLSLIILMFFIGWSLLINGWPRFRR